MTDQDNNNLLNNVVISMAHSLLQYIAEAAAWVQISAEGLEEQVRVLAARQRQDVSELADLLIEREYSIDFGTYPTEYTDLQFLSLEKLMSSLRHGQASVVGEISDTLAVLKEVGDSEAVEMLSAIEIREQEIATALQDLSSELQATA